MVGYLNYIKNNSIYKACSLTNPFKNPAKVEKTHAGQ